MQDTSVPTVTQPTQSTPSSSLAAADVPEGSVSTAGMTASGVIVTHAKAPSVTPAVVRETGAAATSLAATKVAAIPPAAPSQPRHSRLRLSRPPFGAALVKPQQAGGVAQESAALAKASEQQLGASLRTSAPGTSFQDEHRSCRLGAVSGQECKQTAKQQSDGAGYVADVVQCMQVMTLDASVQISSEMSNLPADIEVAACVLYLISID